MTVEILLDKGVSYAQIAATLGMTKSNVAKIAQQIKMRRGEMLGYIDAEYVKQRYLVEAVLINDLATEFDVSVVTMRRFIQAHGIKRDRGHLYRLGTKVQPRKGIRVPGSVRDRRMKSSDFMSLEHREKLSLAKRGKTGEASNRWNGGHEQGGYISIGGSKNRAFEHRVIAEKLLNRRLSSDEQIHHIDRQRKNNKPSNLLVIRSGDHARLHVAMRKIPNLDQRVWLIENNIHFEDLQSYAKNHIEALD